MGVVAVVGLDQVVEDLFLILRHLVIGVVCIDRIGPMRGSDTIVLVVRHDRRRTVVYLWYDRFDTIKGVECCSKGGMQVGDPRVG